MRNSGGDWEMYGEGCKVYEAFDKQQRKYYIARVDGSVDRKVQEATLLGYGVGEGLAPSRSVGITTEPFSPTEEGNTKDTKGTKISAGDFNRESLRDLRGLCVLRGESATADTSTTAGGREALPYNSRSAEGSATVGGKDAAATVRDSEPWRRGVVALETLDSLAPG